jgi:hypothetical protein
VELRDFEAFGEPGAVVYLADCLDLMRLVPTGSVDAVFADPPYRLSTGGVTVKGGRLAPVDKGRWDRSLGSFERDHAFNVSWLREARRLLKPDGTVWVTGTHHVIFSIGFALQSMGFKIINVNHSEYKSATPWLQNLGLGTWWSAGRIGESMSHTTRQPDPLDTRYLKLVMGRLNGVPDQDIATELECGSAVHMYQRFSNDNYPVCAECGAAPINKEHACKSKRQWGPGTDERAELPAPSRASELFADLLRGLLASVADLEFRYENSQDGRIVGTDTLPGPVYFSRRCENKRTGKVVENWSEDQWHALCASHGQDPAVEGFWVEGGGLKRAAGAARHPAEPLTTLIGVYALAGGDMKLLLEALYPGTPGEQAREAIRKRVEGKKRPDKMDGLKAIAGQLAALVRGQTLTGAPSPGLTAVEHDAACYITMLREEKRSYEEILAKLSNHRTADGSKLSMADVHRLADLKLRYTGS